MKKISKLILKSYVGPFLIAFSVILFILVLQFLAKYLEDIIGKDIGGEVLGKVFIYTCLTLVTLALPLAILLSSLLTMGNLGERYELAAMRSSGIGLLRIMRPLISATLVITMASLFFSFYIMPIANLKLYTLLYDLANVKPTFALQADHFYSGIDGIVIHVDDINRKTDVLYGIKVYDHTKTVGNHTITLAESGTMLPSKDEGYLRMTLYDGVMHQATDNQPGAPKNEPYQRFYFDTLRYEVPLSGFNFEESSENTLMSHHYMLDIQELAHAVDSMTKGIAKQSVNMTDYLAKYAHVDTALTAAQRASLPKDTVSYDPDGRIAPKLNESVALWFPDLTAPEMIDKALQQARGAKSFTKVVRERIDSEDEKMRKYRIEIQMRVMLPVSCIVFLFLGAPLGAIIRKGGIGIPVLFSILFFILFYILMIQGRKLARDDYVPVWMGVWLPVLVMFPFAMVFSYQSQTDSAIMYHHNWYKIGKRLTFWLPRKAAGVDRSTMTIEELIALREKQKRDAKQAIDEHALEKEKKRLEKS